VQQLISVSGNGGVPSASLSNVFSFGTFKVGTSSAVESGSLTNTGLAPLVISSITTIGDFSQTNNCPATLQPNQSCTINVTFSPTAIGARSGSIVVTSNSGGTANTQTTVGLSGTGN
jgi:hypothetical protein